MKRLLAAIPIAALTAWFLPAAPASPVPPRFTCRASALRIEQIPAPISSVTGPTFEPFVANREAAGEQPGTRPCATDTRGALNQELPSNLGSVRVLFARTTGDEFVGPSQAEAGVIRVALAIPGAPAIAVDVLTASAQAACPAGAAGPTTEGRSRVIGLTVGTTTTNVLAAHQDVPIPSVGTIHLNEQTVTNPGGPGNAVITQRAFWFESAALPDIIIAEAIADVHNCQQTTDDGSPTQTPTATPTTVPPTTTPPTTPPTTPATTRPPTTPATSPATSPPPTEGIPQCSDEIDNDGDGKIDYGMDPGCESPQDDDETDTGPPQPDCSDGIDNDGDGDVDFPYDPGCVDRDDDNEDDDQEPSDGDECQDGEDNEEDGSVDLGDAGCQGDPNNDDEAAGFVTGGHGYDFPDHENKFGGLSEDIVVPGTSLRGGTALPCDIGDPPGGPTLTTSWHHGDETGHFKLDELTRAYCRNDPFIDPENPDAEFDTYVGEGTGALRIRGVGSMAASAKWALIDRGEPGAPPVTGVDFYEIFVCVGGVAPHNCNEEEALFRGTGTLDEGNLQTHTPRGRVTQPPPDAPTPSPSPAATATSSPSPTTASPTTTPTPSPSPTRTRGRRPT